MKTLLKILFFAAFAVAGILAVSARKTTPKQVKAPMVQSATYYYYPKVNMYYDLTNSIYIYRDNDGKWQSAKQVSDKVTTGMGKKAVLINPSLPVWKSNDYHRMVYSTALYANSNDFRKAPPKAPVTVSKPAEGKKNEQAAETKKETGIERFFKRLFKKKSAEEKDKKA
jgi:hypothetical protein